MKLENKLDVVRVKLVLDRQLYSEQPLNNYSAVYELMKKELIDYDREVFCILNIQSDGRCNNMNIVSIGGLNQAIIEPREVFKSAILSNADRIILVHNHPSGRVNPSPDDIRTTKRLVACGAVLGIFICDHIIIGGRTGELYSFAEHGLIEELVSEEFNKKTSLCAENQKQKQR